MVCLGINAVQLPVDYHGGVTIVGVLSNRLIKLPALSLNECCAVNGVYDCCPTDRITD